MEAINYFRKNPDEKERFVPFKSEEGKSFYHFSAPIWVEGYCLKCHGKREDAPDAIRTRYASSFNYEIGDLRGVMSIKMPSAHLDALVWTNFKMDLWIHLGGFLSLFLLVSWLLRRYVTTPLGRLASGLESVADGNFSQPPREGLSGEMAIVGEAFENMSKELNHREDIIKESERRNRVWLDNSPVCTKVVDLDFNLKYMSAAGIKALKVEDVTKLYGKPYPFDFFPESFKNSMTKNLEKVKRTGEIITEEAPITDIEGNELWFQATIVPIIDNEGRIEFFIIVSVDINERKKIEDELLKMQKLESVGILAGGIAHDFNNYLQRILGNIEIAKISMDSNDKIYTNLTEAEKAVFQARDLTQQLLTFSKGGFPVKKVISVSELIGESVNFALSGSNIKCEFDLEECLCLVDVDKGQFNQVFNNLFINADQAMPKGGVVKVSARQYNIEKKDLLPLREGRYVKITIKDQGLGISQENLQKIFDPYFTTKKTGSGLGLATAFSIIKKHDGYIEAESEPGTGTTFNIYLPASSEEISREDVQGKADTSHPKPAEEEHVQKEILLDGSRILLMDDDLIIAKSVSQQLKRLKCEVRTAKDGTEALKLYKESMALGIPFDAVILDLTIPGGMGGAETMKKLLETDPDVVAIVASGYSDDPIMTDFKKYGFRGVVEKPYEIYELSKLLQAVMRKK